MKEDKKLLKKYFKEDKSDNVPNWLPVLLRDLEIRGGLRKKKERRPRFKLRPQLQSRGPFTKSFSGLEYLIESNKRGYLDKIIWYSYDTGYDVHIKVDNRKTSYSWEQLTKISADNDNITASVKAGFTDYYIVGFYGKTAGGKPRWTWDNKFKFGVDAGKEKIKLEDINISYVEQERIRIR